MQILDCTLLQPAYVKISDYSPVDINAEALREFTMFVYIDYYKKDIVLVDTDGWAGDRAELRKAIWTYLATKRRPIVIPNRPEEGFDKMRPETYMNNEDQ